MFGFVRRVLRITLAHYQLLFLLKVLLRMLYEPRERSAIVSGASIGVTSRRFVTATREVV